MTDSQSQKKDLCLSLGLHDATGECAHAVWFSEEEAGGVSVLASWTSTIGIVSPRLNIR